MPIVTTSDQTELYVKDWGTGQPVVLIHGWPLNADSWETQALGLTDAGYRVVSYDRRGFGRSGQPYDGYGYDTLSDDLAAVMGALDLKDAVIAGFSMGGGEVSRYMSRHAAKDVSKAMLISSIAPFMAKAEDNPDGVPDEVFGAIKAGLRENRPEFLQGFFEDFYGQGSKGGGVSDAVLRWTWSMAMMASPKATLDCVDAFGKTDLRGDMEAFGVPTLIVHGTGDKTVPIEPSARQAAKMIAGAELKEYEDAPHGLTATHGERLTQDMLDFLKT